jgi:predicted alpha/beta hydrolase family esterase
VAPADDLHCSLDRAKEFAEAWGSKLIEAGNVGHLNTASGHGPWPEGLMQFGLFLSRLNTTA